MRISGGILTWLAGLAFLCLPTTARALDIVLDFTLDAHNENWFGGTPEGLSRRAAIDSAADFLSAIITNDDWDAVSIPDENLTFSDLAAGSINDLNGNPVLGDPEGDGAGFFYDIGVTNRSSVAANEYVVYVGAFPFDAGTSAHAKASWNSSDRRNAAGMAEVEFNTWGGKIYFDSAHDWYVGENPGVNPTHYYGWQDPDKTPPFDTSTDNWSWSTSSQSWKGFDLESVDPAADDKTDLYATALHELIHALGATESIIEQYVSVDPSTGEFTGANLMAVYGGPVPGDGGHFAANTQAMVWNSEDIVSETVLDPSSNSGVRKYLTDLDAALLRDLGYQVVSTLASADFNYDTEVDQLDLFAWEAAFGVSAGGDADGDFATTGRDLLSWQRQFGASQVAVALPFAIPEPAPLSLAAWFSLVQWRRWGSSGRGQPV